MASREHEKAHHSTDPISMRDLLLWHVKQVERTILYDQLPPIRLPKESTIWIPFLFQRSKSSWLSGLAFPMAYRNNDNKDSLSNNSRIANKYGLIGSSNYQSNRRIPSRHSERRKRKEYHLHKSLHPSMTRRAWCCARQRSFWEFAGPSWMLRLFWARTDHNSQNFQSKRSPTTRLP